MTRSGPPPELRPLHPGRADAPVEVLDEPLSFWGGVDRVTGTVIDAHHPQQGRSLAGRVLVLPTGRGSSSSSSVLAEVLRNGTGPAGIVLREPDLIISLGVLVADELYGNRCPVLVVDAGTFRTLRTGDRVRLEIDGDGVAGALACRFEVFGRSAGPEEELR